jgi:hypothetical protein
MDSTHTLFLSRKVLRFDTISFNHVDKLKCNYVDKLPLQPPPRPDLIDKKVIDGHVIPNHVIFTSSAPLDQPFETEAFEDNLKVTATFFTQNDGKSSKSKGFWIFWEMS